MLARSGPVLVFSKGGPDNSTNQGTKKNLSTLETRRSRNQHANTGFQSCTVRRVGN